MADDLPAPLSPGPSGLDRSAMERVLARAAELQANTGEAGDQLTEAQIVDVGKEVGLSPEHIRQALAEERTRVDVTDESGGMSRALLGAGRVAARRTVPGTPSSVLATLNTWMQRQECLQVKRQQHDRIVWEARRDLVSIMRRNLDVSGRDYALSRAFDVSATVVAVDPARVLVSLDADVAPYRASLARYGVGISALGIASSAVLVPLGVAVGIAAAPAVAVVAASYYGIRTMHHRTVARAQLALEQLLDRLERGESGPPPSLLSVLASAASNVPRK